MMVPDSTRSATDVASAEDTSLALPSDKNLSSGQQRVLNQVHSIKRGKSKYNKNGTSPTSPAPQTFKTYNDLGQFKFRGASTYSRTNSTVSAGFNKGKSRSLTTKSTRGRFVSTNMEQQLSTTSRPKSPNGLKPSRSDPALTSFSRLAPVPSMKLKGQAAQNQFQVNRQTHSMINGTTSTESHMRILQSPSAHSQTNGKLGTIKSSKIEQSSMVNSTLNMSDITLKEAVEYLLNTDETYQQYGASFIQHICFSDESAKAEVFQLNGIPPLVNMLESSNPKLVQAASGALRNLVHKNLANKMEVQKCGGIAKVLNQMKNSASTETKKQLAGLVWNLSSADKLKNELMTTALPALTKNVVVPFTTNVEVDHQSPCVDPVVFHYATGCLRNLSSASNQDRQKMRECSNLIESLMKHVSSCVAEETPDDESVENCMCTLHNLTFQLWKECPDIELLSSSSSTEAATDQSEGRESPTVGCFSPRSRKVQNEDPLNKPKELKEGRKPVGVQWLFCPKALETYISLLVSSKNVRTLEASCGAMQNLTASKEQGSATVSEILFPKLYSELVLPALIWSPHPAVQKSAVSLVDNMSRKPNLIVRMAKQTLPDLVKALSSDKWAMEATKENKATVCKVIHRLLLVDQEMSKKVISKELIASLNVLSEKDPEDSAASTLLYNLWVDKFLYSITKKLKLSKSYFVNARTIAAINSSSSGE